MFRLPSILPSSPAGAAGASSPSFENEGSYDITIAGLGFRLATDTQFPYSRESEPMSAHKFTSSAEPAEQLLTEEPWPSTQSSFHGGAGQRNLETSYTAFQYLQEQIQHVRFETSQLCDVWTPGRVTRLPDSNRHTSTANSQKIITATVGGVDYAVVGGPGVFYHVAWASGVDSLPTVNNIDMSSGSFGGVSNCTISSLCTDGLNYYAVVQLTSIGTTPGILTYIISGSITSYAAPTALYEVPNYTTFPPRTNLCTNPSGESGTTGWSVGGSVPPTLGTAALPASLNADSRSNCFKITWGTGTSGQFNGPYFTLSTTIGKTYSVSCWAYVPSGGAPDLVWLVNIGSPNFGNTTGGLRNQWVQIRFTFTATATSHTLKVWGAGTQTSGQLGYFDEVLIEEGGNVGSYFDGAKSADANYTYSWSGTADASTSLATPIISARQAPGVVGWAKERLIGALSNSIYELAANVPSHSALPSAKYTRPGGTYVWSAISESPRGVLAAGSSGNLSSIQELTLDTSGNTPELGGGATIWPAPIGEVVYAMQAAQGSFLAVGTSKGVRVGSFDTYSGTLTLGPPAWDGAQPVQALSTRDRFIYAGYTNSQPDGTSGLACLDLGVQTDAAARNAWAPHLKPPTSVTGNGTTYAVDILPNSLRLVYTTPDGLFVEGNGPGSNGTAFIRTSRVRFGTTIPKLFKSGQLRGALNNAQIQVTCLAPYSTAKNCGTFGNTPNDPGDFALVDGVWEWVQMQFALIGSSSELNSYRIEAVPQQHRQRIIQFPVLCFRYETDRGGFEVQEPQEPHDRYTALEAIEQGGGEVPLVEFTTTGELVAQVTIKNLKFVQYSRPTIDNDVGGYILITLRTTES